jgi:hypothetical protein
MTAAEQWTKKRLALAVTSCLLLSHVVQAEDLTLEQTTRYLSEKIPIYAEDFSGVETKPGANLFVPTTDLNITFDGCRMRLNSRFPVGDTRSEVTVDFQSVEPVAGPYQDNSVILNASGYRRSVVGRYLQVPANRVTEEDRMTGLRFRAKEQEPALRLTRAFEQMRKLCNARPEPDPFATR